MTRTHSVLLQVSRGSARYEAGGTRASVPFTLCVFFGHQRCTHYHRVRAMKTHAAVIKCTQMIYEGSFDIVHTQAHACYGVLYMTIGLKSDWTYAFNTYLQVQRARSIQRKHSSFEHI